MRIGVSLSEQSIGWFVFATEGDEVSAAVAAGVRVFPDGREPKTGETLGHHKSQVKARRRKRDRYVRRRAGLSKALSDAGLLPSDPEAASELFSTDPFEIRVRALNERIPLFELGRILMHLNKRRGFQPTTLHFAADKEFGEINLGTRRLENAVAATRSRTVGEFLHLRRSDLNTHSTVKNTRIRKIPQASNSNTENPYGFEFFPTREQVKDEFEQIWAFQERHYPEVLCRRFKERVEAIIFFQKPVPKLQSGYCKFFDEDRLPKAHPLVQRCALLSTLNGIRIVGNGDDHRRLTLAERDVLLTALNEDYEIGDFTKVSLYALGKLLGMKDGRSLELESGNRKSVLRDPLVAVFSASEHFVEGWLKRPIDEQWRIVAASLKLQESVATREVVKGFAAAHSVTEATARLIQNAQLPKGTSTLGSTAASTLLDLMQEEVRTESEAMTELFHRNKSFWETASDRRLPYYGEVSKTCALPGSNGILKDGDDRFGRVANPTLHICLNQLRRVLNKLIEAYGFPDSIAIHLGARVSWSQSRILLSRNKTRSNERLRRRLDERLLELGLTPNGRNRLRLRLWQEIAQSKHHAVCPYSGQTISLEQAFDDTTVANHILPYSRTLDNSYANRILCMSAAATEKQDLTPWEAWGHTSDWPSIEDRVATLPGSKAWRFSPESLASRLKSPGLCEEILSVEERLSALVRNYVGALFFHDDVAKKVKIVDGRLIETMSRIWGVNDLKLERPAAISQHHTGTREDYRWGAVAAALIASIDKKAIDHLAETSRKIETGTKTSLRDGVPSPWQNYRDDILSVIAGITVSHKPDHGISAHRGRMDLSQRSGARLHGDTAFGIRSGNIAVYRKNLENLTRSDIRHSKAGRNIRDAFLRTQLLEATDGLSGKALTQSLAHFSSSTQLPNGRRNPYYGMRRARLQEAAGLVLVADKSGAIYKGYKPSRNHRYEVWRLPDGAVIAFVVSVFDAHSVDEVKPHPAAKLLQRWHKNDLVYLQDSKFGPLIGRIEKFDTNGTIEIVPHNEKNASRRYRSGQEDVFLRLRLGSLLKYGAQRIFVDEIGRIVGRTKPL